MSTERDLIWIRSRPGVHFDGALAGGSFVYDGITANATNTRGKNPALNETGAHRYLQGQIEHLRVCLNGTATAVKVAFFSGVYTTDATFGNDHYIDHESFTAGDFEAFETDGTTCRRAALSNVVIPYHNLTGDHVFHLGVENSGATTIPDNHIFVEFAFRADRGRF